MKKRLLPVLGFLAVALGTTVHFVGCKKQIYADSQNLLFITIDTCRADRIGAYGCKTAQTPVLDDLAGNGILFENCRTSVPLTLPSHCSIFTGKYPVAHGVRSNGSYFLNSDQTTLAESLKENGFHTFAVVAAFVLLSKFGLNQGFDIYDDSLNSENKAFSNYSSEITADKAYAKFHRWLGKSQGGKFFAWLHLYDPHEPYAPPAAIAEKFPGDMEGRYQGEIAFVDSIIGNVINDLRNLGLLENTLIVVMGDHGEGFGEHQEFEHGFFCYEETLKVPLLFFNRHLFPEKRVIRDSVDLVDIMPTMLELFRIPLPPKVQGKSLLPVIRGRKETKQRTFYIESMYGKEEMNWAPLTGIIRGSHKYISLPQPELYDLIQDKDEKQNLYSKNSPLAGELDRILQQFLLGLSESGLEAKRELSAQDREQLKALGYISALPSRSSKVLDPKDGIILSNQYKAIMNMVQKDDLASAKKALDEISKKYPEMSTASIFDLRYRILLKENREAESLALLDQAIKEFPQVDRFYLYYAMDAFKKGRYEAAEAKCRELLQLSPLFAPAHIMLGDACKMRGDVAGAISHYRKALEIEPQNISLNIKYAELLVLQQDYQTALKVYDDLFLKIDPASDPEMLLKIALLHSRYGSIDMAEELLALAVKFKPDGRSFFNYALILAKNNKFARALESMKTAISKYNPELSAEQREVAGRAIEAWSQASRR